MSKPKSLIVILLDESENMKEIKFSIISKFNKFLAAQKSLDHDDARVIFLKFNKNLKLIHNCKSLKSIRELDEWSYNPIVSTSLNDSIYYSLHLCDKTRNENESVLFVIITNGKENSSNRCNTDLLLNMIEIRKNVYKYNFIYLEATPENFERNDYANWKNVLESRQYLGEIYYEEESDDKLTLLDVQLRNLVIDNKFDATVGINI